MAMKKTIVAVRQVRRMIHPLRGNRVLLDFDLAELYGVQTKVLNQAVKRNSARFPRDFMFQLTSGETRALRSQFVTLKRGQHLKYRPYAFTEQGVAMLSSVLSSERAVKVNIAIMRAFVHVRETLETNRELAQRFSELEGRVGRHDKEIAAIIDAIRQLVAPVQKPAREMGFHVRESAPRYPRRKP
jgi:hypothetical protein